MPGAGWFEIEESLLRLIRKHRDVDAIGHGTLDPKRIVPYLETFMLKFVRRRTTKDNERVERLAVLHPFEASLPFRKFGIRDA